MTIGPIRPGDIVECDIRGQKFLAYVLDKIDGKLLVSGCAPSISYTRQVTARQVRRHWRQRKAARAVRPEPLSTTEDIRV